MTGAATLHQALRTTRIKQVATIKARAALAGGTAIEANDDHGRFVLILTLGSLTREGSPDVIEEVLDELGVD